MKVHQRSLIIRIVFQLTIVVFCLGAYFSSQTVEAQTPPNECDFCILQFPSNITAVSGSTTQNIYGRIFEAGVTEAEGASASITAQLGYGPAGSDPRTSVGWTYFNATFNVQVGNDDEYQATMIAPQAVGTYRYTFRFSLDGGANWSYADLDGAGSNPGLAFDPNNLGAMGVATACPETLTPNSQYFSSGNATGIISISAGGSCNWTAVSNVPWITITSPPSFGNGEVIYLVDANPDSTERTGTITIGAQTFTVVQASGSCIVIEPPVRSIGAGSTGIVPIYVGDVTGQGIVSFSISLAYNPSVVTFAGVENAGTLSSGFTVGANVVSPGVVRIAGFGSTPLLGSGDLINLRFTAIGAIGSTSPLSFTDVTFNEGGCFQWSGNGSIEIVGRLLSGSVLYGTASTPLGIAGVLILGTPNFVLTDADGAYIITGLGTGGLTIFPRLVSTPPVNGISALDASLVLQAVLGLATLTPNQLIAADVSGNGSITPFDAALLARYAVGLPNTIFTGTWRFSPAQRNYTSLPNDLTGQDFALILIGEVTGNWTPPAPLAGDNFVSLDTAAKSDDSADLVSQTIKLSLPVLAAARGTITIPIGLDNYNGQVITAFQFDLVYDPHVISPAEVPVETATTLSNGFAFEANTIEPGRLRVAVYGANSIAGNGTLVNLRFNTMGSLRSRTELLLDQAVLNEGQPASQASNGKLIVKR